MTNLLEASTLWDLALRRAERTPDATMLIDAHTGAATSFRAAVERAQSVAAGLHGLGVREGGVVAWQLPTGVPAVLLSLALARLGALQHPLISLYGEREVGAILRRSRAAFYLFPAGGARDFSQIAAGFRNELPLRTLAVADSLPLGDPAVLPPPPAGGDDVRWVYYTSGTTSEPKGARHTDRTLMIAGRNLANSLLVTARDVGSIAFPIGHVGGAMYLTMLLASGMSAVLLDRFVPAEAVAAFRRHGVTTTGGSTAHYEALLAEQGRQSDHTLVLPDLRIMSGGGAPRPPELHGRVRVEMDCILTHNYGMTEVPLLGAASPLYDEEQLARSDGRPVDDVELRIVRPDGTLAAEGEIGEVRVRGEGVFKGYTDPELDAAAFDEDGFFRTGDLGYLRADGLLRLTGRLKDIIIRKGENISAAEIEELLYSHPSVGAVAVIGLPDPACGERVCAVVEPRPGQPALTFPEMVAFFKQAKVMVQKIPEQLEIIDNLPRSGSMNKIHKQLLHERYRPKA